ncbi:MAG TPA: hypothetical protein VFW87_02610 [Pirellulales bacterium]|nr:hypothetical protein [Pirellulales bacterium]
MATEKQKDRWITLIAVLVAVLLAFLITGYTAYVSKRLPIQKMPVAAKIGFVLSFTAGTACQLLWGYFGFRAKSKRKPGVSWLTANHALDFPFASRLYTEDGVRNLRKGRNCFLAWLLLWAIAMAISFVG